MTITLQVNELIQSLESAGELSIKEQKYLDIMRWAVGVAGERDAALNAERVWEKTMMEACGEDGPASVASEIRALQVLRDTRIQALNSQVEQLAAENAFILQLLHEQAGCFNAALIEGFHELVMESGSEGLIDVYQRRLQPAIQCVPPTPATDRIVAGIKAEGAEACVRALVTLDDDDFSDAPNICAMVAYQLRKGEKS